MPVRHKSIVKTGLIYKSRFAISEAAFLIMELLQLCGVLLNMSVRRDMVFRAKGCDFWHVLEFY